MPPSLCLWTQSTLAYPESVCCKHAIMGQGWSTHGKKGQFKRRRKSTRRHSMKSWNTTLEAGKQPSFELNRNLFSTNGDIIGGKSFKKDADRGLEGYPSDGLTWFHALTASKKGINSLSKGSGNPKHASTISNDQHIERYVIRNSDGSPGRQSATALSGAQSLPINNSMPSSMSITNPHSLSFHHSLPAVHVMPNSHNLSSPHGATSPHSFSSPQNLLSPHSITSPHSVSTLAALPGHHIPPPSPHHSTSSHPPSPIHATAPHPTPAYALSPSSQHINRLKREEGRVTSSLIPAGTFDIIQYPTNELPNREGVEGGHRITYRYTSHYPSTQSTRVSVKDGVGTSGPLRSGTMNDSVKLTSEWFEAPRKVSTPKREGVRFYPNPSSYQRRQRPAGDAYEQYNYVTERGNGANSSRVHSVQTSSTNGNADAVTERIYTKRVILKKSGMPFSGGGNPTTWGGVVGVKSRSMNSAAENEGRSIASSISRGGDSTVFSNNTSRKRGEYMATTREYGQSGDAYVAAYRLPQRGGGNGRRIASVHIENPGRRMQPVVRYLPSKEAYQRSSPQGNPKMENAHFCW